MMQPNAGGIAAISPQATQQPMPGQANPQAIQGVLQQGQGAGPPPQGGRGGIGMPLSQVPIELLYAAAQGHSQDILPYQAISELQDRIKKQKMQQAMQGQQAMAAAAQQAQQPPVAQQILEEGRQLAKLDQGIGASEYGFADGGIVAFSKGGKSRVELTPEEIERALADPAYLAELEGFGMRTLQRGVRGPGKTSPETVEEIMRLYGAIPEPLPIPEVGKVEPPSNYAADAAREVGRFTRTIPSPPTPRPPAGTGSARESARVSASARVPGAAPGMSATGLKPPSAQDIYGGVNKELERTIGELGLRKNISPEEQRLRDILARQSQENIEAQRADIATGRKEAEEARAKGTTQPSLFDDAEGLFALAGSIDTRKGKVFGSASKGMSGILRERRLSREAAEKDYKQYLREERAANASLRQIEMLETQRQLAVQSGDRQRVEAIDDKINVLKAQAEQNRVNAENTVFGNNLRIKQLEIEQDKAESDRIRANAAMRAAQASEARGERVGASGKPLLTAKDVLAYQAKARARVEESVTKGSEFARFRKLSPEEQTAYKERRVKEELANELRNIKDLGLYEVPDEFLRGATPPASAKPAGTIQWNKIP